MAETDQHRIAFDTMAIAVIELDASRLHAYLAELGITAKQDVERQRDEDPRFLERSVEGLDVVYANAAALGLFGAERQEQLTGSFINLWAEGQSIGFNGKGVEIIVERKPSFTGEARLRRVDGVDLPVIYTCWSLSGDMTADRLLVSVTDVTEQKQTERTLARLRTELAHAGRISILGELSASITHEVNQPLTAVVASAQTGLRWLNRPEPDLGEVKTALETIILAGRRATDVVGRMRAMSKKQELELVPLSVNELIEETLLFLSHELAKHQVRVHLDLTDEPTLVPADRTQLQQVLVNLFMNAAQAMSNARSWRRILTIRSRPAANKVRIEIEDTGPGIRPPDLERLFDSFFTTKAEGMGMGLPICRSIVEAHGGTLDVSSRPSLGAAFRFELASVQQKSDP